MLKKSTFEKFAKEMKEKFNDEYILILATDIDGEWELQQVEEYGGTYGLTLGSHRADRLDDSFLTFANNHINEFEKPHNQIIRKYNLPEEVTDYILYMVEQLKQMKYDDFDRGCYDDDFYYSDCDDEDSYDED